jgi:CBS domain-containing protein
MKDKNVLAVPVLSGEGKVVATLSASDLRGKRVNYDLRTEY